MGDNDRRPPPQHDTDKEPPAVFSCEKLAFETRLFSPKAIAATLPPVTKLDVVHRVQNGAAIVIAVLPPNNDEVGSVNHGQLPELIDCLKKGNRYEAVILETSTGGLCIVRIYWVGRLPS